MSFSVSGKSDICVGVRLTYLKKGFTCGLKTSTSGH